MQIVRNLAHRRLKDTRARRPFADHAELLALSAPVVMSGLVMILGAAIDVAMMGHYSIQGLAGVAAAAAILTLFSRIITAMTLAYQLLVAKRLGAGDRHGAGLLFFHTALLAGTIAIVLGLGLGAYPEWFVRFVTQDPESIQEGRAYLPAAAAGLPLLLVIGLIRSTFDATRQTRWGMHAAIITGVTNAALDYLLIYGPGPLPSLGSLGNGLGSTAALVVGLCYLGYSAKAREIIQLPERRVIEPKQLREISRMSWPLVASMLTDYVIWIVLFAVMSQLGSSVLGGGRIAYNVLLIIFTVLTGLSTGARILIGRSWGAGDLSAVVRYRRSNQELLAGTGLATALVLALTAKPVAHLYTPFAAVRQETIPSLLAIAVSAPVMGWTIGNVAVLRALGRTQWDMYGNLIPAWIVFLPGAWWLGVRLGWGLVGIFLGLLAFWIVRGLYAEFAGSRAVVVETLHPQPES